MTNEDEDAGPKGGSSPNARRGEPRSPPVIEGTARELKDLSPSPDPAATESRVAADTNEPPLTDGAEPPEAAAEAPHTPPDPNGGLEPPERVSPRGSGALSILALLIALVALATAAGFGWRVFYARAAADAGLEAQVAALKTRVDDLGALDQRVAALEASAKATSEAAERARSDASKALEQATAARTASGAAEQTAAAAKSSALPGSAADLTALDKRLAALEQRPDARAVQTEVANQSAASDKKLSGLGQSLTALDQRVADLNGRLAAQAARLNPLEALLKAPKLDVPAIEASNAKAVNQAQASALIVVARSLEQAIDSGAPFATEAAAAQKLGADPTQLQKLQASAATGAPTAIALKNAFEPLAGPILAGVDRAQATGLLGRLTSGLGKLVRVSTIGQPSSDDRVALVGRIEGALADGDVAAALAARDRLPAPAQAITASWAAQARARVSADQAAHALLNDAVDRLGKART